MESNILWSIIIWSVGLVTSGLLGGFLKSWLWAMICIALTALAWGIAWGVTTPDNTFSESQESMSRIDTLAEVMVSAMGPNWPYIFFTLLSMVLLIMVLLYFASEKVVLVRPGHAWTWVLGIGLTALSTATVVLALRQDNCTPANEVYLQSSSPSTDTIYIAAIAAIVVLVLIGVVVAAIMINRKFKKKQTLAFNNESRQGSGSQLQLSDAQSGPKTPS